MPLQIFASSSSRRALFIFFFVIYTDGETGSLVPYFQFVMNFSDSRRSKWSVDYLPISYYGMHGMLHR